MTHRAWPMTLPPPSTPSTPSIAWYQSEYSQAGVLEHANTGAWQGSIVTPPTLLYGALIDWVDTIVLSFAFAWEPLVPGGAAPDTTSVADQGYFFVALASPYVASEGMLTVQATVDGVLSDEIILSVAAGGYPVVGNYSNFAWGPAP